MRKENRVEEDDFGLLEVNDIVELHGEISDETFGGDNGKISINEKDKSFDELFDKLEDVMWKFVFMVNGEVDFVQLINDDDVNINVENRSEEINIKGCIEVKNGDIIEVIRTEYVRNSDEISVRAVDEIFCKIIVTQSGELYPKFYEAISKIDGDNLVLVTVEFLTKVDKKPVEVAFEELNESVVEEFDG